MGMTFVYNDGESEEVKNGLELKFGMFFDGTLNSKENTRIREAVQANTAKMWERELYQKHGGKPDDDVSFQNDYTNVSRMQMSCNEDYAIYIEGIGTEAIPEDVDHQDAKEQKKTIEGLGDKEHGFAMGSGATGIRAKVYRACEILAENIKEKSKGKKSAQSDFLSLTLDVFGFSRGAAAARNFLYEVNSTSKRSKDIKMRKRYSTVYSGKKDALRISKVYYLDEFGEKLDSAFLDNGALPRMGYLGYLLLKNGLLSKEELKNFSLTIRFIGIYDTVSSYENVKGNWGLFIFKAVSHLLKNQFQDDVRELQLNNLGYFQKSVHFTAQDEHRENFDLTRMVRSSRSHEFNFPGVHCDVGGAYLTGTEFKKSIEISSYKNDVLLEIRVQELIDEYWYKPSQIGLMQERVSGDTVITGTRYLKKEYSYIPLHFMEQMFKSVLGNEADNVFFESITEKYPLKVKQRQLLSQSKSVYETKVVDDQILINAKDRLSKYVFEGASEWKFVSDKELKRREIRNQVVEENNKTNPTNDDYVFRKYERDMFGYEKKVGEQAPEGANEIEITVAARYDPQSVLRKLRNEYLHWSARRGGLGMDPRNDYKRVEH